MKRALFILTVLSLALLAGSEAAQGQGGYELSWWTVDGGGTTFSEGGDYTLGGTSGQPDAGELVGGSYTLNGGFWYAGAPAVERKIYYLPLILKNYP